MADTQEFLDKILNEDCLETMARMPDNFVDLIVTDPPYLIVSGGMSNKLGGIFDRSKHPHTATGKMFGENTITFTEWVGETYRVLKDNCHAYIMVSGRRLEELFEAIKNTRFEFQNLLVWDKGSVTPNRYYMQRTEFILMLKKGGSRTINNPGSHNIISIQNEVGKKTHPTQKPVELMSFLISNSTNINDLVYDPFMGSGTTAIACKNLGRRYIGSELSKEYCDIAKQRLSQEALL